MMHQAPGYVVVLLHQGKPVREFAEGSQKVCRIPFDSEYTIRIKNKTWRRALVSISIDGTDVLSGGKRLILSRTKPWTLNASWMI